MNSPFFRIAISLALFAWFGLGSQGLIAQQDSLAKYFDDNGLSTRKNILATNLLAPISGVLGVRYERALTKGIAVEVGAYKLMPFYLFELLLPIDAYISGFDPKGGIGLSGAAHFYFSGKAPEFHWMGPRYGFRRYVMQNASTMTVHDFSVNYGYNLFLSKHFMFCYDVGWGYRRMMYNGYNSFSGTYSENRGSMYMFYSLGLGVMF